MRIFQIIESSTNTSIPTNSTWHRNLYEPLIEMGHDVFLFSASEGRLAMKEDGDILRAKFSQKLLEAFRQEHKIKPFSLVFAYLMDGMVETSAIDEIRKAGVITCNFSCNNAHQFYLVDQISPHFDYNLHSEKFVSDKFTTIGANPLWWPMASNPKYFKPINVPRNIQASFVGANYAKRAHFLNYLLINGINTQIYGPGWINHKRTDFKNFLTRTKLITKTFISSTTQKQNFNSAILADYDFKRNFCNKHLNNLHAPVTDDFLIELYSRSHISLGFLEVYDNHDPSKTVIQHLHLREFEAPMCGALLFTGFTEELNEMFVPDKEVVVYRNEYELVDKAKYYLAHPNEAEKIRINGRKRALSEHTYHLRFSYLFKILGLS
jgi:spore maturation protein CgeB